MPMPTVEQVVKDPDFQQLPPEEQRKVLQQIDSDFNTLPGAEQTKAILGLKDMNLEPAHIDAYAESQAFKRKASSIYTPLLEGGMGAAGGLVAGAAASPTGVGVPLSIVAGGALGHAAGSRTAKLIDEATGIREPAPATGLIKETAQDLKTGAQYEMVGLSAAAIIVPVWRGGKLLFIKGKDAATRYFSAKGAQFKAGKILSANTSAGPIYAKNAKEAAKIEAEIPGLKFTLGQKTYDPALIKLERTQFKKPGKGGATSLEQIAENNKALKTYYERNFAGQEGIDDVIESLRGVEAGLAGDIEAGTAGALQAAHKIKAIEPHHAGRKIGEAIETVKGPVKSAMGELEAAIPDYPMQFENIKKTITTILKNPKISSSQRKAIVKFRTDFLKESAKGESTHRAMGIRRTLNDEINSAYARGDDSAAAALMEVKASLEVDLLSVSKLARTGKMAQVEGRAIYPDELAKEFEKNAQSIALSRATKTVDVDKIVKELGMQGMPTMQVPHEGHASYITRLSGDYARLTGKEIPMTTKQADKAIVESLTNRNREITKILSKVEPGKDVAAAMNAYNEFASKEYFGKFDVGATKRAGAAGTRPENIPGLFTTASGTGDLIRAVGWSKAREVMKGYYSYNLFRNATDPATGNIVTSKLSKWFHTNKLALNKLGLLKEFKGVVKAQIVVDEAQKAATAFEKSAASRLLKADPKFAVKAALTGSAPARETAQIMKQIGNNKAAVKGMQNAYAEYLTKEIETTVPDIAGGTVSAHNKFKRIMDKFGEVAGIIYKNEPQKLKALQTMRKAYEISIRNQSSPIGGGPETAETLLTELGKMTVLSRPVIIAKGIWRTITKYGKEQVDDLITRALFDGDYADTLVRAARGQIKSEDLWRIINGKVYQLDDLAGRYAGQVAAGAGMAIDEQL